jgi:pimeloyl-ACP methyl ester carboxylesterase
MKRLLAALIPVVATLTIVPVAAGAGPDPVLLVHGYRGDPSTWRDMKQFLESKGRTVYAIDLPSEENRENAEAIRTTLRARGWLKVDIVGQSMGGLSARWFRRFLAGDEIKVNAYVAIGTPEYGMWSTCVLPNWYGGQMCPSGWFLDQLNAGDDTPGATYYTTIYSTDDGLVPTGRSRLEAPPASSR